MQSSILATVLAQLTAAHVKTFHGFGPSVNPGQLLDSVPKSGKWEIEQMAKTTHQVKLLSERLSSWTCPNTGASLESWSWRRVDHEGVAGLLTFPGPHHPAGSRRGPARPPPWRMDDNGQNENSHADWGHLKSLAKFVSDEIRGQDLSITWAIRYWPGLPTLLKQAFRFLMS